MFFASEKRIFVKKVLTDDTGSNRVLEMSLDISGVGFVRILRSTIVFRDVCLFVGGVRVFVQNVFLLHPPEKKKTPPFSRWKPPSSVAAWKKSQARDSGHTAFMMMRFRALPCIMAAVRPWEFGIFQPGNTRRKNAPKGCGWLNTPGITRRICFSIVFLGVFLGGDFWKHRILGSGFIGRLKKQGQGLWSHGEEVRGWVASVRMTGWLLGFSWCKKKAGCFFVPEVRWFLNECFVLVSFYQHFLLLVGIFKKHWNIAEDGNGCFLREKICLSNLIAIVTLFFAGFQPMVMLLISWWFAVLLAESLIQVWLC